MPARLAHGKGAGFTKSLPDAYRFITQRPYNEIVCYFSLLLGVYDV